MSGVLDLPIRTLDPDRATEAPFAFAFVHTGGEASPRQIRDLFRPGMDGEGPHVWLGAPGPGSASAFEALLSEEERDGIRRFRDPDDGWSRAAARCALRLLLAARLSRPPESLTFRTQASGALGLDLPGSGEAPGFSLSHAKGLAAVALGAGPLGVDVEPLGDLPEMMDIAARHFSASSQDRLAKAAEPEARRRLFFRFWTLSEAYGKAKGTGLAAPPPDFRLLSDQGGLWRGEVSAADEVRPWRFESRICGPALG